MSRTGQDGRDEGLRQGFGAAVRRLRTGQGLSREQLAGRTTLGQSYIAKIEQGARLPREPVMAEIAEALQVQLPELLTLAEHLGRGDVGDAPDLRSGGWRLPAADLQPASREAPPVGEQPPAWAARQVPEWLRRLEALLRPFADGDGVEILHHVEEHARRVTAAEPGPGRLEAVERLAGAVLTSQAGDERLAALVDALLRFADAAGDRLGPEELQRLIDYSQALARQPALEIGTVGMLPPGRRMYVFSSAVGRDDDGDLWINPRASVRSLGLDEQDPRVERWEDGRILLDVSALHEPRFEAREPDVHVLRAMAVRGLPGREVPWQSYVATTLEIVWSQTARIAVDWAELGSTAGEFPASASAIHVVSAHNPAPSLLPPEVNAARNERLKADIQGAGIDWRPAVGHSANPHEPWEEPGFALVDVGRDRALELGRRYGQSSVFEWTPGRRSLLLCNREDTPADEARFDHGWRATWR